jgi:hypothetical protein
LESTRGIPTSKAYWELKAEEVLNRVFCPPQTIAGNPVKIEIHDESARIKNAQNQRLEAQIIAETLGRPGLQTRVVPGIALALSMASIAWGISSSNQSQEWVKQQNALQMLEHLRGTNVESSQLAKESSAKGRGERDPLMALPPPPPEPWIQELANLPSEKMQSAPLIQGPMRNGIGTEIGSTKALGSPMPMGTNLPVLVGVVQSNGLSGTAIFDHNGSSSSVTVGESIGTSGWRLKSTSANSVIIVQGEQQKRLIISNGF